MVSLVGQKMYFKQKLFYNFVNSQTPNLRPRKNHSNFQSPHCHLAYLYLVIQTTSSKHNSLLRGSKINTVWFYLHKVQKRAKLI